MVFYHADDYGMNVDQSKRILECADYGLLNSISIFPNTPYLKSCMSLLSNPRYKKRILRCCWHVNLTEGHSCSEAEKIPVLVNTEGVFRLSFLSLLLKSILPGRKALYGQLVLELQSQLDKLSPYLVQNGKISIDGHQHIQMIPIVMKAIKEVITENGMCVDYYRISKEPLRPYMKVPAYYLSYSPINILKNFVLRFLYILDLPILKNLHGCHTVFWGLLMSGNMDHERVHCLMPYFKKVSHKQNIPLEILFHPGGAEKEEDCLSPTQKNFVSFYLSQGRNNEYNALRTNLEEGITR